MTPEELHGIALRAGVPKRVLRVLEATGASPFETRAADLLREATGPQARTLVVLAGPTGTGKTCAAARLALHTLAAGRSVRWLEAFDLSRVSPYDAPAVDALKAVPLLVVDDLGREYQDDKGFLRALIDGLLSARYDAELATVITTNLPAAEFAARYGERLVDRIREVGAFLEAPGPSLRRRPGPAAGPSGGPP